MPDAVITVENLSKSYLLGHRTGEQGQYRHTLRDVALFEVIQSELESGPR